MQELFKVNHPQKTITDQGFNTENPEILRKLLSEFYGKEVEKTEDLETNACCDVDTMAAHSTVSKLIPSASKERYYGCGSPLPDDLPTLKGLTAIDLGSGSGVDSMILRYYLGPKGTMIGVDMTDEQLAIARTSGDAYMKTINYDPASLRFEKDFIETLECIPDASVDLVISNCVVNLSPRKDLVFKSIQRVLKPGGEFFISDIVADRRVDMMDDEVLVAECLGLAPYIHDAHDLMEEAGFPDVRVFSQSKLPDNKRVLERGDCVQFYSLIWRGYKLANMDRRCEDYGQVAIYKGNLPSSQARFTFDEGHIFEKGRPLAVCKNTARMLSETRLKEYFTVTSPIQHFGLFEDCGSTIDSKGQGETFAGGCC